MLAGLDGVVEAVALAFRIELIDNLHHRVVNHLAQFAWSAVSVHCTAAVGAGLLNLLFQMLQLVDFQLLGFSEALRDGFVAAYEELGVD